VQSLPTAGLLFGGVLLYALVLVREGRSRADAQALVKQLEAAQSQLQEYADQVEELTISQERQRMAREMHDTLAQGLAGVILQLEAADSHLETNHVAEARVVVKQAMHRARQTLHEARRAIQALRSASLEQTDLAGALASEVSEFEATWGVPADLQTEGRLEPIPPDLAQHVLRIVQEGLNNAGRHARARHVQVGLVQEDHGLRVTVQDDGKGFDVEAAMRRPECFGLQGMDERARRIGGDLRVESTPGRGTCLTLNLEGVPGPGAVSDGAWSSGAAQPGEEEEIR
jgi:two-component system, NarL family, sensor histidine kinase YdfH